MKKEPRASEKERGRTITVSFPPGTLEMPLVLAGPQPPLDRRLGHEGKRREEGEGDEEETRRGLLKARVNVEGREGGTKGLSVSCEVRTIRATSPGPQGWTRPSQPLPT